MILNNISINTDQSDNYLSSETSENRPSSPEFDLNWVMYSIGDKDKFRLFIQYRGKASDELAQKLHQINAPCRVIMTMRKLKTMLPSLKPVVACMMKSNIVYKITCPRCQACYVGATTRHLRCRFSEHRSRTGCSVKRHIIQCGVKLGDDDIVILGGNNQEDQLFTLEAIFQHDIRPTINGKEEFRTKTLSIIF